MSKRSYRQTRRAEATEGTRTQIVVAARHQLVSGDPFTIDAVARRAGVTRATVYAQFSTRDDLREAVFDQLAESGGLTQIPRAFVEPDPMEGLRILVEIFCGFYTAHRATLRRLNALAALASTASGRQENRNDRRRQALTVLVGNIAASSAYHGLDVEKTVSTIQALTSFEFFDQIAHGPQDVAVRISGLVNSCLESPATS